MKIKIFSSIEISKRKKKLTKELESFYFSINDQCPNNKVYLKNLIKDFIQALIIETNRINTDFLNEEGEYKICFLEVLEKFFILGKSQFEEMKIASEKSEASERALLDMLHALSKDLKEEKSHLN